jgi:hypothetical protein
MNIGLTNNKPSNDIFDSNSTYIFNYLLIRNKKQNKKEKML